MEVKSGIWKSHILSILLISFILCPIVIFFYKISIINLSLDDQWIRVFINTVVQASVSALLSIVLGIPGALGFCALSKNPYLRWIELISILPAVLPPLMSVLAWMNVTEYFFRMPFGWSSVIATHVLMNVGLVSVLLARVFSAAGGVSAWALVHGVKRSGFIIKCLFYEWKSHLVLIFIIIFSFCFTSFSVPLLVGGASGQTLEVFIAESLKDPVLWPQAVTIFGIEVVVLFLFFGFLYRQDQKWNLLPKHLFQEVHLLSFLPGLVVALFPSLLLLWGLLGGVSMAGVRELYSIWPVVFSASVQTVLVGLGTGIGVLFLLCWIGFCLRSFFLRKFLVAYVASTQAFMGFCFLLIGLDNSGWIWFKWSAGLALIFLPALYRLMGEPIISHIKRQVLVADLMGASFWQSFVKIILPQAQLAFFFLAGIAAFWAVGDFAYSGIVALDQQHLALLIQDIIASYRLELASILIWILLIIGIICFAFFVCLGFIFSNKVKMSTDNI